MTSAPQMRRDVEGPSPSEGPLFLRRVTGRAGPRRPASTAVAHEMYCYLRWAQGMTAMTTDEILVNVMDRALADYFSRDRSWRSSRVRVLEKHPTSEWGEIFGSEREGGIEAK